MKFKIPSENYESLEKKIKALNNKALKLNLDPIELDIIYSIGVSVPQEDGSFKEIKYLSVNVNGSPPVLSDWRLIGIIEPTEKGNFITEIGNHFKYPEISNRYLKEISLDINRYGSKFYQKDLNEIKMEILKNIDNDTFIQVDKFKESILALNNEGDNKLWNYQLSMKDRFTYKPELLIETVEFKKEYDKKLKIQEEDLKRSVLKAQWLFEDQERKKNRVHVGVEGEKTKFKVTIEKVVLAQSEWGNSLVYTFRDKDENCIIWFNSGKPLFDSETTDKYIKEKKEINIMGTVKNLGNYNDEPQTQLIRVKHLGEDLENKLKAKKAKLV